MKIGIMQPYFFPYLGYYSLIKATDQFVLFDNVQFIRHGWIERNRVLKPVEGWQYVSVPLEKKSLTTAIKDARIRETEDWRGKIVRQLDHYKKRAPFYKKTIEIVESAININTSSIVKLNENILKVTCEYLEIPLTMEIFSDMSLEMEEVTHPGEWALNISKAMSAHEYFNPMGGIDIFQPEQFKNAGITLNFLSNNLDPYSQGRALFEPGLSIIDVMMFNDITQVNHLIDNVQIIRA